MNSSIGLEEALRMQMRCAERNGGSSSVRTCVESATTPGGRSCDSQYDQKSNEDRSSSVTSAAVSVTAVARKEHSCRNDAILQAKT